MDIDNDWEESLPQPYIHTSIYAESLINRNFTLDS